MGGRGAGKTRIALIAPTFHDVREVLIEGHSGLRSLPHERPAYEASRRRLVWSNGAQASCLSAEDPEALRGPQFDAAWCDELCYWSYPDETLETLQFALRIGARPRMMVTTTPRPMRALKDLLAQNDTVVTRSTTFANEKNLSADFIAALKGRWEGTARHRQELLGELIEEPEGALWKRARMVRLTGLSLRSIRRRASGRMQMHAGLSPLLRAVKGLRGRLSCLPMQVCRVRRRTNGPRAPQN
jgi:phage terminase large subunit-like protein